MWDELDAEVSKESRAAVETFTPKTKEFILDRVYTYDFEEAKRRGRSSAMPPTSTAPAKFKEYHEKKYFATPELPENVGR